MAPSVDELFDEMLMNYSYELSLIIQQTVGGFTLHEQTEILNLTITFTIHSILL